VNFKEVLTGTKFKDLESHISAGPHYVLATS